MQTRYTSADQWAEAKDGVIVKDGLYFKDLDNSGELAPYKDWRLSPEQRAEDMVKGYQDGDNGLNEGSVVLTIKHFPGDAPSENGFEPHVPIGQWRIYRTPGSMEKYHLPPFQRAFDHKVSSIMPDYSRIATDGRAVPQTYRGEVTSTEEVPSAYSKELITDLARNKMGFEGYVNSDSGITTVQIYGVEDLTEPERYAKAISAGTDVISGDFAPTGKLSLTMVSDPAVIAITEQEIDGVVREICASPNDVPGYDKDQYIDPAILANVKGGSYAYCDADGNYYRSGFGLNY